MHGPVHALSQQTPSVQKPEAQLSPAVHAWPFLPLQLPVASPACPSAQLPGTSVPGCANTQVPSAPGTSHDLHAPEHAAVSQHTPSTQFPEAQAVAEAVVQPSPLARLATEYTQVSLATVPELFRLPPNRTTRRRPASYTIAAR